MGNSFSGHWRFCSISYGIAPVAHGLNPALNSDDSYALRLSPLFNQKSTLELGNPYLAVLKLKSSELQLPTDAISATRLKIRQCYP